MIQKTIEAYIYGPKEEIIAKRMILITCALVAFSIISTAGMYAYYLLVGHKSELGALLNDPTVPVTLLLLAAFGFLTYKEKIWAAIILLLNQLLDLLVLFQSSASSIGIITVVKILIYVGAIRAIWYLTKQKKSTEPLP
jgi:hypothetical protein